MMRWQGYRLVPGLSQNFAVGGERSYRHLSRRTEACFTTLRFSEVFHPNGLGHDNPFNYQLTDLTFRRQVDGLVTRVIKQATNLATVV